ncbi:MAG: Npun_F5749 family FMN-dependent PPOX-type flavoprotein [Geitlerinemataceae cyanobacterium]
MSDSSLAPWRSLLAGALHRNRSLVYARYFQLATIAPDGSPTNRTVVFRGFLDPGDRVQIITDARSEKIPQLAADPRAEVCWYFPKTREQFRLTGTIEVVTATTTDAALQKARRQIWHNVSDGARSSFAWPEPGADRADAAAFEVAPLDKTTPLDSFVLLVLSVDRVDRLQLRGEPQARQIFTRGSDEKSGWDTREVNP